MSNTNSPIELLVALGINTKATKANIQSALNTIQNDLNLNVNLQTSNNSMNSLSNGINNLSQGMTRLRNNTNQVNKETSSLFNSFNSAFPKFSVWMAVSTIFYGITRSVKSLTEKVIELDTAMTNLIRVADGEQFEFDKVVERSIENVTTLSGKLTDYMALVNEFARTGKTIDESFDLANTTQMLLNISDLNADESFNSLTAAMIAYNIAAEDSARIADRLNELDNNFAITTKDLSQALNKTASTAKTFGVELDTMLGHVVSIGSQSRESGNIVGNSLKTLYARIATNKNAINALSAIGISMEKVDGTAKSSAELIDELARKWDSLSEQQQRHTSVNVAGIYQLSRFNALMLNYEMAIDATNSSLDSYGSAMREQEKYNQSLEARINRLSTAWYDFSDAMGNTIVYDSLVVVTSALEGMGKVGSSTVGSITTLAITLGLLGAPLSLVSTRFHSFSAGLIKTTAQQKVATVSTTSLTGKMWALAAGTTAASNAFRTLLMVTGVGIAIALVTGGLSLLINKLSEAKQESEDFDTYVQKNTDALTTNKERTDELIESYKNLSKARESGSGWDAEKEKDYLSVQQTLADIFPSLIDFVDANGQAHLKTSDAIDEEINKTNELIDTKHRLQLADSLETFGNLSDRLTGGNFASWDNFLKGNLNQEIENAKQNIRDLITLGMDTSEWDMKLLRLEQEYANVNAEIKQVIVSNAHAQAALNGFTLDKGVINQLQSFVSALDFSNLDEGALDGFSFKFSELAQNMQKAVESGDTEAFNKASADLNGLASTTKSFDNNLYGFNTNFEKFVTNVENSKIPMGSATDEVDEFGNAIEDTSPIVETLIDKMEDFKDVVEQMAGVSQSGVDALGDLLFQYDMLSNQLASYTEAELLAIQGTENLTEEQLRIKSVLNDRIAVMEQLSSIYPDILGKDGQAIALSHEKRQAIELENQANQVLLDGYKLARDGKLNAEQNMTLATITGTKNRILEVKKEIQALQLLQDQMQAIANTSNDYLMMGTGDQRIDRVASSAIAQRLSNYKVELGQLDALLGNSSSSFGKVIDDIKASEKSKSKTKEDTYVTDEYKQALEALNLEIEKQQALQDKYSKHDSRHRAALEAQIKLEKDKLALQQKQATILQGKTYSGTQKDIDEAKSNLVSINSDILKQQELIEQLDFSLIEVSMASHQHNIERYNRLLEYNKLAMESLSKGTDRYTNALAKNNEHLQDIRKEQELELQQLRKLAVSGEFTGTVFDDITARTHELTMSLQKLNNEIQENNYEIVMDIKVRQGEKLADLNYDLDVSEIIQSFYDEGSALWTQELQKQMSIYEKIKQNHDETRRNLQQELQSRDLTVERIKEITQALKDETLAYLNAEQSIQNLQRNIADVAINAQKDYYSEVRDMHMKSLDDRAKAEKQAHDNRMKQLKDEMDLYRKNANEMLELIDRQEADRDYNMEIDEMESKRNKIQEDVNRLALDTTNEGKQKRKRLLEELDKIDKEIAEKRRDREIELQKQSIQDNLEAKELEIKNKEESQQQQYDLTTERLDNERESWQKYYNDILNDERKFAKIREDIMSGNFSDISKEFQNYISHMVNTVPQLGNSLDGTMKAVGTSIRQNVIDNLREAMNMLSNYNSQSLSLSSGNAFVDNFNPNANISSLLSGNNSSSKLTEADMKVIVAKYMNEQMSQLGETDVDKWWINQKASDLAATGRLEGSKISPSQSLNSIITTMSKDDLKRLASFTTNLSSSYIDKSSHQQHMREWATKIASLDSGGYLNFKGNGFDGKGGRLIVGHPNEVVLNKVDTKSLFDNIDVMSKITPVYQSILQKFQPSSLLPSFGGEPSITVQVTGDNHYHNDMDVNKVWGGIKNKVRNRGGRI